MAWTLLDTLSDPTNTVWGVGFIGSDHAVLSNNDANTYVYEGTADGSSWTQIAESPLTDTGGFTVGCDGEANGTRFAVTCPPDNSSYVYDLADLSSPPVAVNEGPSVYDAAFGPAYYASTHSGNAVYVYTLGSWGSRVATLSLSGRGRTVALDADHVIAGGNGNEARVWETGTWTEVSGSPFTDPTNTVWSVELSTNYIAYGGDDGTARVRNRSDWSEIDASPFVGSSSRRGVAFTSDESRFAASDGTSVRIYDTSDWTEVPESPISTGGTRIEDIDFSADDRFLLVGDSDDAAFIYDTGIVKSALFDVAIDSTNAPITAGETLDVNYTVTNTGGEEGTQDITLDIEPAAEPEPATVYESYEDNDLSGYTFVRGSSSDAEIVTDPVYHGTYALALTDTAADTYVEVANPSLTGPSRGETFRAQYHVGARSDDEVGLLFAVGSGASEFYEFEVSANGGNVIWWKYDGSWSSLGPQPTYTRTDVTAETWTTIEVDFGETNSNDLTGRYYNAAGDLLVESTVTDATLDGGGIGWYMQRNNNLTSGIAVDYVREYVE